MASKDYKSLKEEHDLFSWSKPVGYDFKEVEEAIAEYKEAIERARDALLRADNAAAASAQEVAHLRDEMIRTQSQVEEYALAEKDSNLSDIQILENFKQGVLDDSQDYQQAMEEQQENAELEALVNDGISNTQGQQVPQQGQEPERKSKPFDEENIIM